MFIVLIERDMFISTYLVNNHNTLCQGDNVKLLQNVVHVNKNMYFFFQSNAIGEVLIFMIYLLNK